jgi:universal stress protein F
MYKKILVPVDLGREKNAIKLCRVAAEISSEGSQIRLISVAPGYGMSVVASFFPADAQEKALAEMLAMLTTIAENNLGGEVSVRVREGKRSKKILEEAEAWSADLIVVGSRKKLSRGGQRVLGSCSSGVADRAQCAVLIVRGLPLK